MPELSAFVDSALALLLALLGLLLHRVRGTVARVVPKPGEHLVTVKSALADAPFCKSESQHELYRIVREDPRYRNTSYEDVRGVQGGIGKLLRELSPEEQLAQLRDMTNW